MVLEVIAPVVFVTDVVLEPVTFFTVELLILFPDVVLLTPLHPAVDLVPYGVVFDETVKSDIPFISFVLIFKVIFYL